jgi:hypothetical protein
VSTNTNFKLEHHAPWPSTQFRVLGIKTRNVSLNNKSNCRVLCRTRTLAIERCGDSHIPADPSLVCPATVHPSTLDGRVMIGRAQLCPSSFSGKATSSQLLIPQTGCQLLTSHTRCPASKMCRHEAAMIWQLPAHWIGYTIFHSNPQIQRSLLHMGIAAVSQCIHAEHTVTITSLRFKTLCFC